MTLGEAQSLAEVLKGAIPTMTDLQIGLAVQQLQSHDHAVGEAAVRFYITEHDEFRLPSLLAILKAQAQRLGVTSEAQRRKTEREQETRTAKDWICLDVLITQLPAAKLAQLKAEVIGQLPEFLRRRCEGKPVAASPMLKGHIAKRLRPRGAVA